MSWSLLIVKEETQVPGAWEKDSEASACKGCDKEFNIARRKHHCRYEDSKEECHISNKREDCDLVFES